MNKENIPAWKPLIMLEKAMAKLVINRSPNEDAAQRIKNAIVEMPRLPLTHHYLGRKYFLDSNWVMAELYLTEAIRRYQPGEQLKISLKSQLEEMLHSAIDANSNCLLTILMNYQYDEMEEK